MWLSQLTTKSVLSWQCRGARMCHKHSFQTRHFLSLPAEEDKGQPVPLTRKHVRKKHKAPSLQVEWFPSTSSCEQKQRAAWAHGRTPRKPRLQTASFLLWKSHSCVLLLTARLKTKGLPQNSPTQREIIASLAPLCSSSTYKTDPATRSKQLLV